MTTQLVLTLGEILMVWRVRAGYTQTELGELLDMGRNTVSRWEADEGRPRWRDIEAWAEACGQDDAEAVRPEFDRAVANRTPMGRPRPIVTDRKGPGPTTGRPAHAAPRRARRHDDSLTERLSA